MSTDRKLYNTEYARRRRKEAVVAGNANAVRCTAMLSRRVCGARLQSRFVDGQTVAFCPAHDRKSRGLCIDCGAPHHGTVGKTLRCALHSKLAKSESIARYRKRNKSKLRRKEKKRLANPELHADRLEYKRLYRKALPSKVKEQKRAHYERNREKINLYMAAYRERHREKNRERERLRNAGALPARTCLTCPTIVSGRAKRCDACKQRDRADARAQIAVRVARQVAA